MKSIEELRAELQQREQEENDKSLDVLHEHIKSMFSGKYELKYSSGKTYLFIAPLKNGLSINALITIEPEPYLFAIGFGRDISYKDNEVQIMKILNRYAIKEK